MFKIGEFSKLSNSTIRALHYYEEKGLLMIVNQISAIIQPNN